MTLLPCYDLKIDVPCIKPDFENPVLPQTIDLKTEVKLFEAEEVFTQELINFFIKRKLIPRRSQMGYTVPGAEMLIHLDGYYKNNKLFTPVYAINWVVNPENTSMRWFDDHSRPGRVYQTSGDTTLTWYAPEDVTLLYEKNIVGPTLVRVDIPHQGVSNSTLPRWCYSLRLAPYVNTWEQAVDMFSDLII